MKVLKEGPGWGIKQICTGKGNGGGGCGATLQVEKDDIYMTSRGYYDGSTDFFYAFRCPCCNIENEIISNIIPPNIKIISLKDLKFI